MEIVAIQKWGYDSLPWFDVKFIVHVQGLGLRVLTFSSEEYS